MMPIWVFGIFITLFAIAIVWDRIEYKKIKSDYENLEFFLDLYIKKYGNLEGMLIAEEEENAK